MKKRVSALVLTLLMLIGLFPCTIYAATDAPYSLQYLKDIPNAEYKKYEELDDDDGVTNSTIEVYDILWMMLDKTAMKTTLSWDECILRFRDAFINAGFEEIELENDSGDNKGDKEYFYTLDMEHFIILGEKRSQKILNESGIVYVLHYTTLSNSEIDDTKATDTCLDNFTKVTQYTEGQFQDVRTKDWFYENVKTAYELGLVKGVSETRFNPSGTVSLAETITLAARINSIYKTGKADFTEDVVWYQPYVDYAIENSIIKAEDYRDYNKAATRAQFALILKNALPEEALPKINNIAFGTIPDVDISALYSNAV